MKARAFTMCAQGEPVPGESDPSAPSAMETLFGGSRATPTGLGAASGTGSVERAERPALELSIPAVLKAWLVDDAHMILTERQIVRLPAEQSVEEILTEYIAARPDLPPPSSEHGTETTLKVTRSRAFTTCFHYLLSHLFSLSIYFLVLFH